MICRNKEQCQEHVTTTTTRRLAQHSPWNTNTNCPELSWQQSTFGDKQIKAARQQHTHLHNHPHSNWSDIKTILIRGFASAGRPARQSRFTVTGNVLGTELSSFSPSPRTPSASSAATSPMSSPPSPSDSSRRESVFGGSVLSLWAGGHCNVVTSVLWCHEFQTRMGCHVAMYDHSTPSAKHEFSCDKAICIWLRTVVYVYSFSVNISYAHSVPEW